MGTKKEVFGVVRAYPFAYTNDFERIMVVCPFCHNIHSHYKFWISSSSV